MGYPILGNVKGGSIRLELGFDSILRAVSLESSPTSTEFSNRTLSRRRGLLSRPLEDEAQVPAEVQEHG